MTTSDTQEAGKWMDKHFEVLDDILRTVDGCDLTHWTEDDHGNQTGLDEGTMNASEGFEALDAIKKENARLLQENKAMREALKELVDDEPIDSEWGTCGYCNRKRHEKDCPLVRARTIITQGEGK